MARRLPGSRRRWAALAVAVAAVVLAVIALDSPSRIESYRVIDDRTIAVTTVEGRGAWTRVGGVEESATAVAISIRSFRIQLGAGTAEGIPTETTVTLHDPLGARTVIDASSGAAVERRP